MRHRAMGDVELMIGFVNVAKQEHGLEKLQLTAQQLLKQASVPIGINPALLDDLPEGPGVYFFYGEDDYLLYIGKSINIRARVMSHFTSDHASSKEMKLTQQLKRIDWIETAGELGALLLESRLVKERLPLYNHQLRRERQLCSWQINQDAHAVPLVKLVNQDEITPDIMDDLFGTFKSKKQAVEALRSIATEHQLCQKLLGLESGKGACFAAQIKRCNGACCGKEDKVIHHLKLKQALVKHRLKAWPYATKIGVREHNKFSNITEIHVFDQWCHLGTVNNEADLAELTQTRTVFAFDLDSYKVLLKMLAKPNIELIKLESN